MDEKNLKIFLDYILKATAEEEYSMQEESVELKEVRQKCQECMKRIQAVLPKKHQKLISDFDDAKNLKSSIESDITVVITMRFLIRLLKCLELL
ncbi:MAG: hypothetical protein HFI90_07875 [Clostridia bacterium]|nr:hypothetical protein [Clostridia bacterium]